MAKLQSVWGTCDGVDILFHEAEEGVWETTVPADLQDGQYIIEVWGQTATGYLVYTTAVLYLCDSRCVALSFVKDDIYVRISTAVHLVTHTEKEMDVRLTGHILNVSEKYSEKVVIRCS